MISDQTTSTIYIVVDLYVSETKIALCSTIVSRFFLPIHNAAKIECNTFFGFHDAVLVLFQAIFSIWNFQYETFFQINSLFHISFPQIFTFIATR